MSVKRSYRIGEVNDNLRMTIDEEIASLRGILNQAMKQILTPIASPSAYVAPASRFAFAERLASDNSAAAEIQRAAQEEEEQERASKAALAAEDSARAERQREDAVEDRQREQKRKEDERRQAKAEAKRQAKEKERQQAEAKKREEEEKKRARWALAKQRLIDMEQAVKQIKETVAQKWCPQEIVDVSDVVNKARKCLIKEDVQQCEVTLRDCLGLLEEIKKNSLAAEEVESTRKHLVKAFLTTMEKTGITGLKCYQKDSSDPRSSVIISGFRSSGSPVAGIIPHAGEVSVDFGRGEESVPACSKNIDAFEKILEQTSGVKLTSTSSSPNTPLAPASSIQISQAERTKQTGG